MKGGLCDVFDRGLIPRKGKELQKKLKHQRTNQHVMNRQFSKCKVRKANKHSKESSILSHHKMQIKTILSFHRTPIPQAECLS